MHVQVRMHDETNNTIPTHWKHGRASNARQWRSVPAARVEGVDSGGGGSIYRYFIYGILYYIRLHYTIFYYIILHYTVLYCIVLYCIISCLKSVASANPAHEVQAALTHKRRGTILSLGDAMQEGPPLRAHVAAGTLELPSLPCELHTGGDILRHVEEKALRPGTGGDDCAISGSCCCCLPRNA